MPKLTPEMLGEFLFEEFSKDSWGDVDVDAFKDAPKAGSDHEMRGMYEVLARVTKRINDLYFGEA